MSGFSIVARRVLSILALGGAGVALAAGVGGYVASGRIALSDGRLDYARVDPVTRTLFVARWSTVTAVPLDGGAPRDFGAIHHGHAVVPLPGGRLAVTSGDDDTMRLFDQASGAQLGSVAVGKDPDAAIRDANTGDVLVVNAKGGTVSVVDPAARKVVRTITLKPGLEFAAQDRRGLLFVNNETDNVLHVADPRTGAVLPAIALTGCDSPSGLAYDATSGRLIAACANGKAAVIDAASRRLVGLLDIGEGPDAVIVDGVRRLAFIPCGKSATLVEIALDGPVGPHVVATIATDIGAKTGAVDPATGALYLPAIRLGEPAGPGQKPDALPGSAHVVVVRAK